MGYGYATTTDLPTLTRCSFAAGQRANGVGFESTAPSLCLGDCPELGVTAVQCAEACDADGKCRTFVHGDGDKCWRWGPGDEHTFKPQGISFVHIYWYLDFQRG